MHDGKSTTTAIFPQPPRTIEARDSTYRDGIVSTGCDVARGCLIFCALLKSRAAGDIPCIQSELQQTAWSSDGRSSFMLTRPSRTVECGDDQGKYGLCDLGTFGFRRTYPCQELGPSPTPYRCGADILSPGYHRPMSDV